MRYAPEIKKSPSHLLKKFAEKLSPGMQCPQTGHDDFPCLQIPFSQARSPLCLLSPTQDRWCRRLWHPLCDIPLLDICDYNVTRDRCKDLGCCFYKGVCYEKAVPVYVQVFSALIVLIAGAFIIAIVYRVVQESKRETELSMESSQSSKANEEPKQLYSSAKQDMSSAFYMFSTKRETDSQMEAELTLSETGETED